MRAAERKVDASALRFPVTFEPNVGQTDPSVSFLARAGGLTLFLSPGELVAVLRDARPPDPDDSQRGDLPSAPGSAVRLRLAGASPNVVPVGIDPMSSVSNYLIGADPIAWRTRVPHFSRVRYARLYPGVDLELYGRGPEVEYDFVVAPGGRSSDMLLSVEGATGLRVGDEGDLVVSTESGELRQHRPVAYQPSSASHSGREPVSARFALRGPRLVGFEVGPHDPTRTLVIDPVLSYSARTGGSGDDVAYGVATDSAGAAYVVGSTASTNFPTTTGPFPAAAASSNAFIAKVSPGGALLWSTYVGGSGGDAAIAAATDGSGRPYMAGFTTSADFPLVGGTGAPYGGGTTDAFVARLDVDGTALLYSTYVGGGAVDYFHGLAVDAPYAYAAGWTESADFPVVGAFQPGRAGGRDAVLVKIDTSAAGPGAITYATHLGGAAYDGALYVAADAPYAYVAGTTDSTAFPTRAALRPTSGGGRDAFVAKVDTQQAGDASLVWSTYLGGSGEDSALAVAVSPVGGVHVAGGTKSSNFPTASPLQAFRAGDVDAYAAKLRADGSALEYSTYLGGSGYEFAHGLAVDEQGNAYVVGGTRSSDFPLVQPVQSTRAGDMDAFVAKVAPDGSRLMYATYLGGTGYDFGEAVAAASAGAAYVVGETLSPAFPGSSGSLGAKDAYVSRIELAVGLTLAGSPALVGVGGEITYTATVQNTDSESPLDVVVTDDLPDAVSLLSATSERATCTGSDVVVCDVPSLAIGETATISIVASAVAGGVVTNVVTGAVAGAGPAGRTASVVTTICTQLGTAGKDTLVGSDADDVLCGLEGNDTLRGGGGNDLLVGGAGSDSLSGGLGDDALDGGTGTDTALYDVDATGGVDVDLAAGVAMGGLGADTIAGVENVVGSGFDDRLSGNASANVLNSGAGRDQLIGGSGNDTLIPGAGDDAGIDGGAGNDTLDYTAAPGDVSIDLAAGAASGAWGSDSLIAGIERVKGSNVGNDTIVGSASANTLWGNGGSDALHGGAGNDTLYGGGGDDSLFGDEGDDRHDGGAGNDTCSDSGAASTFVGCEAIS